MPGIKPGKSEKVLKHVQKMRELLAIVCLCALFFSGFKTVVNAAETLTAETYQSQMEGHLLKGDFRQTVINGIEAERLFGQAGRIKEQVNTLISMSAAYQQLGKHKKALEDLTYALALAEKAGLVEQTAHARGRLGNAYVLTEQMDKAEPYLKEAIAMADKGNYPAVRAIVLNYLGTLYTLQRKHKEAIAVYKEALEFSDKAGERLSGALIISNIARALYRDKDFKGAEAELEAAYKRYKETADSHDKAYGLINIGRTYNRLAADNKAAEQDKLTASAVMALKEAASLAEKIQDNISASYALGYLGQIRETEKNYTEALALTRRAVFRAHQVDAPEMLYLWQWQRGRIFRGMDMKDEALSSFRQAVTSLQSIRQEMMANCRLYNRSSFREEVELAYLGLVDLLLLKADSTPEPEAHKALLTEARRTIELLKNAELQDYFQNACVTSNKVDIKRSDIIPQGAAVIYIITLSDRIEMLAGFGAEIRKITAPIKRDEFVELVRAFRRLLEKRTSREYLINARRLYDLLIQPLEASLRSWKADTLVFITDGPLRNIPLGALYDGKEFLINKFALVTTPGYSLTDLDIKKAEKDRTDVLLAGLTEPVQGYPALMNVAEEMNSIKEHYPGKALHNREFTILQLKKELEQAPYSVVHIASHGEFSGDAAGTFLLAWDEKLTLDHLETFLGISRLRKKQVDLLTLSACRTAAGDDRAALGIAGVAIKAGARSAVATLWNINDQASSELITELYRQMKVESMSKARALQKAQLKLLNDARYRHPYYWSPFLLIGNWL